MNISRLFASNLLWRGTYLFTALLVTIFMSRYLQAYTTGWLFYFISILTFVFMALSFGLDSGITYFVSKGEINTGQMQFFAWIWIVLITLFTCGAAFVFFKDGNEFAGRYKLILMTVLFVSGNLITTYYNALFYAKHSYRVPNIVFICINLLLILILINPFLPGISSHQFIYLFFYSYLLQGLLIAVLYNLHFKEGFVFQLPSAQQRKKLFQYSGIAFFAGLLFYLVTRIDYWLIDTMVDDKEALGNYIQASRLVQLFQMLPAILAAGIFPIAASGYAQHMRESILKLSRVLVAFYAIIIFIIVIIGKWLFPFLFGNSFHKMYNVFLLLVPGLFALTVLALIAAYFAAINCVKRNVVVSIVGLAVIIAANLLLIPLLGIYGAAIASSIGYIVCFFIAYFYFTNNEKVSFVDLLIFKKEDFVFLSGLSGKIQSGTSSTNK